MNTQQGMDLLRHNFIFFASWGSPIFSPANAPLQSDEAVAEALQRKKRYHRDMANAGVKIHSFDLSTGWKNISDFDAAEIDRALKNFFEACPDCYILPRIAGFNASNAWLRAHPGDVCLMEAGEDLSDPEIVECIGTKKQYEVGPRETALVGFQCFASPVWRKDALAALRRLIEHLEASPYADRILGYHVGYGRYGETHFWASGSDFCRANRRAFYDFGVKKYGSVTAAAQAWGVEVLTPENVPLPRQTEDPEFITTTKEFFRREASLRNDYHEFLRDLSYSLVHDFCHTIKSITDKVVGIFHGYNLYSGAEHHGHTDLRMVIDDPEVDFICAPKSYYRNAVGEPGGSYCVPRSVNRKMLWIDELDNRTFRVPYDHKWGGSARNMEEFRWTMWREFARNEMTGSCYWWMDLGGGWYDDPQLHAEMSRLHEEKQKLSQRKGHSLADVLVVFDETNAMHTFQNVSFFHRTVNEPLMELAKTGALFDLYLQSDLKELDLSRYKMVYFLNTFDMTAEEFGALKFAPGTKFLWNYLPCGDLSVAEQVTGMKFSEIGKGHWFPYLEILPDCETKVLETYADPYNLLARIPGLNEEEVTTEVNNKMRLYHLPEQGIRTAQKGDHTVCLLPSPDYQFLRKVEEEAGCRFYAEAGAIVYGDDRFLAIFRGNEFSYDRKF